MITLEAACHPSGDPFTYIMNTTAMRDAVVASHPNGEISGYMKLMLNMDFKYTGNSTKNPLGQAAGACGRTSTVFEAVANLIWWGGVCGFGHIRFLVLKHQLARVGPSVLTLLLRPQSI
jgi:hypothetical protein